MALVTANDFLFGSKRQYYNIRKTGFAAGLNFSNGVSSQFGFRASPNQYTPPAGSWTVMSAGSANTAPLQAFGSGNKGYILKATQSRPSDGTFNTTVILYDVLCAIGNLSCATPGTFALPAFPDISARLQNGSYEGLEILVGNHAGFAATSGIFSLSYTNENSVSGRVSPDTLNLNGFGGMLQFGLAAGDKGVRSVDSYTVSTVVASGLMYIAVARPLMIVGIHNAPAAKTSIKDWANGGIVEISDQACIIPAFYGWSGNFTAVLSNVMLEIVSG